MTGIQRAMLGDHEAAATLTEQGVLIPCPWCGGRVKMQNAQSSRNKLAIDFCCTKCGKAQTFGQYIIAPPEEDNPSPLKQWNTRAPILSAEEMERLDENRAD